MAKPILMAVDDQVQDGEILRRELLKRYADDYEVICDETAQASLQRLGQLRAAGAQVVILLAALRLSSMSCIEFMVQSA